MPLLWITVFCLVALVWVLSVVDIVRQHHSGSTTDVSAVPPRSGALATH